MPTPGLECFEDVPSLLASREPEEPVFCIRPDRIRATARRFQQLFPGTTLYAVKCNPHPGVLGALLEAGIRSFDVASLPEVELLSGLAPDASLYFMHPVKSRHAIRTAYERFGVRHFVVDHPDELGKLFDAAPAEELFVFVRVATPPAEEALYHLSAKFGAGSDEAAELVREALGRGARSGLTFHVGSQCLDPKAYRVAFERLGEVIERCGHEPECIDVGGGFPHPYPGVPTLPLEDFIKTIRSGLRDLALASSPKLLAEPGRALVAGGCSLLARVELRRDDRLYINDGVYGAFSELIDSEHELPARLHSRHGRPADTLRSFEIHGPTCDSMDVLATPLELPSNVREGDWIEVGEIGAYSSALSTGFNGFRLERFVALRDAPGNVIDSS